MTPLEIQQLRKSLNFTQTQLGQLLGVHPMTISKWERPDDPSKPNDYQVAMMEKFREGIENEGDIKEKIGAVLVAAGVIAAVFLLLRAAMKK